MTGKILRVSTKIDNALLANDFHVASIDTNNVFGSPNAVKVRNKFLLFYY